MPLVSIIVPCYNEQNTICLLLEAIAAQTYPIADLEVILADGGSQDETVRRITDFAQSHPKLKIQLINNPRRIIPAALNCAIRASRGEYIIRLDAHSIPSKDYVQRCVTELQNGIAENVGGVWEIRPGNSALLASAIACAAAHPFGVGDARYRYSDRAEYVDTVPFGAFRRDVFTRFGLFDETLPTNEDYEFNARIRQQGGKIWLNPAIRSTYFARASWGALARQYWRYGYWKLRMLQRYPQTLRWRQALPPFFLLSLFLWAIALILPFARFWAAALLGLEIIAYFGILIAGSFKVARQKQQPALLILVPISIAVMHLSWGAGFWWSLLTLPFSRNPAKP